jgi:MFS family permease
MEPARGLFGWLTRTSTFEAFRFREFRLLWLGQFGNSMGQWMDQITRGWLMYQLTESALHLGLISAIRFIPIFFLSPLAGTAADRYGRKTQLLVDQVSNGALHLLLAFLVFSGHVHPWHVYATAVIGAILSVFQQPARQALTPEAVDRAHLTNAIGLNSIAFNGSRSLGPAVAGALVATLGAGGAYVVQGILYILATVWTVQLRLPNRPPTSALAAARSPSFFGSTLEGWRYIRTAPIIRSAIVVSYIQALMGVPFTTMLPIFARDVLGTGADGQGLLLTAMGFGALGTAFAIAAIADDLPKGWLLVGGILTYGIGLTVFSHSTSFPLSLAAMVILGSSGVTAGALVQTIIQAHSPPELRGRILGVFQQAQLMTAVGGLLTGFVATALGAQQTVAIMGLFLVACAVVIFASMPAIRTIR